LDWRRPRAAGPAARHPPAAPAPPGPVDVVVPVYGAAAELAACLASLERHTDLVRHRLVVVVDGDPAFGAAGSLDELAARCRARGAQRDGAPESADQAGVVVLYNRERRGFVASVNRGMTLSQRDVVLLNSDTVVTRGWLEKLQQAALSDPAVATVTPFSNNATICSLPRALEVNALPAGWDLDGFAELVERVAARERPRLPTGVGVCLYVRRAALDRLGLFDEQTFGLGYGEESEFCARATKAGWLHLLDDATFIWHAGQSSFGDSRLPRVRAAHRKMRRLHPEYLPTIARFIAEDPLAAARGRVIEALQPPRSRSPRRPWRIVHLVHGWPPWNHAGTETYARGLALRQAGRREVAVYARRAGGRRPKGEPLEILDGGVRVRLVANDFTQRDPLSRNALRDRALAAGFAAFLDEVRPELVHVHHLAGHAFSLLGEVTRRRIPLVYQVQDWWTPCARANLLDRNRRLCSGPGAGKCAACLPLTGLPPAPLLNRLLYLYRGRAARRAFRCADAWLLGSHAILDSYRALGLLRPGDAAHVLPYGVELGAVAPRGRRQPGAPLRCGVIGSLMPHKGVHVAAAAFAGIDPASARLIVWGDPTADPAYAREVTAAGGGRVELRGRFAAAEKAAIFAGLDLLLVPSLGLESFGVVAREALHYGVPVLAGRRGALVELFADEAAAAGALYEAERAEELRAWIERLVAEPELLERWRARTAAVEVKGMDEHAEEVEAVYEEVLRMRAAPARHR
jgi:GT2 family glycosyltransferase